MTGTLILCTWWTFLAYTRNERREGVSLVAHDKRLHFLAGACIYGISLYLGFAGPMLMVVGAAGVKEIHDYLHGDMHTACILDFLATLAGGAVASVVRIAIQLL